jgi:hypothetical protein
MSHAAEHCLSFRPIEFLSRTLLMPRGESITSACIGPSRETDGWGFRGDEFGDVLELAQLNHVLVRFVERLPKFDRHEENAARVRQANDALAPEKVRIATGLHVLHQVCAAFQEQEFDVLVIKSLDHWPDFGSDLDLFTHARPDNVVRLLTNRFGARVAARSWGDQIAGKWNFYLPDLAEPVEVHIGRLGQTGEQAALASSLIDRARQITVAGYLFRVPSAEDRIMISTLQRMYRHFNLRLCDLLEIAQLADSGLIDFENLHDSASVAGIWEGVATYLTIVSNYARTYRGTGIDLPLFVADAAQFGGDEIFYEGGFLRIPIMPQSVRLYKSQLVGALRRGELHNSARLTLLPWLATAAAAKHKITGSTKGIW